MDFTPNIKAKRFRSKNNNLKPFPPKLEQKYQGTYTGLSVEVVNRSDASALYENGCFGKGSHSRSAPRQMNRGCSDPKPLGKYDETLVLDMEEAFFLSNVLQVLEISDLDGHGIGAEQIFQKFQAVKPIFASTLVAYVYLKSKNWIVKSGTKFGGDFLVYKQGMRYYHASFIVMVGADCPSKSKDVQGIQRVAETSDKDILVLDVHPPSDVSPEAYYNNLHRFSVTETVPKRFDFKKSVQNKQENR